MPTEVGNLARLAYVKEVTFGTTPATPTGVTVRQNGFDLSADRKYIDNPELRVDGMTQAGAGGALMGKGSIDCSVSYASHDALLAAALGCHDWTSHVIKLQPIVVDSAADLEVDADTTTFIRDDGGSFVTDGFVTGQTITTSGFTNAGNNGTFLISNVSALVITCSTATGLVDEADNTAGNITLNTRPSFTMEKAHLTNGYYFGFKGVVVDGFEMAGKVDDVVSLKFDLLAKSVSTEAVSTLFTTVSAANTNALITSWDGSVKKDTVAMANVVGWTLKATRNMETANVVGSSSLYDIQPRAAKITGTLELYFADYALYTAMRAETDVALQINLGPGVTGSYQIDLTRCRIKSWKSVPKDGLMTATVEYESFVPTGGSNTSLMITRTAT